jgi:hypothetical protein
MVVAAGGSAQALQEAAALSKQQLNMRPLWD